MFHFITIIAKGLVFLALPTMYPETEPTGDDAQAISPLVKQYEPAARQILEATMKSNDAWDKLEELCLTVGHRLSGSPGLERAIDWAIAAMNSEGQENVRREKVMVPHWVRGRESATIVKPHEMRMAMLGLGGSVGTPSAGITAPVEVVVNEEELESLGSGAKGKIILFNYPMPPYDPQRGSGYGKAVRFRTNGARLASVHGAVACLVRSVTANSLHTPHCGAMRYGDAKVKIPAAAVSIEDAETIAGLRRRGVEVVVNLKMEAKTYPDAESANVIGELRGTTWPDEVVVIGGHIDAWDVGHGAHDDGGGCVIAMDAINILRKLKLIPKRTIRVVLWTNEENGLRGGKAYARDHADELKNHVAAIESDSGVFAPRGYSVQCHDKDREHLAAEQMRAILSLLQPIGLMTVTTGYSGADISPMGPANVVLMGHRVEGSKYFDYHHSPADTIDKVDRDDFSRNVAALATVAYVLADMPLRIGDKE